MDRINLLANKRTYSALIVNQKPQVTKEYKRILSNVVKDVWEAQNVSSALEILARNGKSIDIIITEALLSDINIVDFIKGIRKQCEKIGSKKILVISALENNSLAALVLKEGADAYIQQSILTEKVLKEQVQVMLQSR